MTTIFEVDFSYGGYTIAFTKTFDLPFTPFLGSTLIDRIEDSKDNDIELVNNDSTETTISFDVLENEFNVIVSRKWRHPVTEETVDAIVKQFDDTRWQHQDISEIQKLKDIMKKHYEVGNLKK